MITMVGCLPGCCARAASGHAAAPPSSVMKSRRLHCPVPPMLPTGRIARLRMAGDCCIHLTLAERDERDHADRFFSKEVAQKQATPLPRQDLLTARNRFRPNF